MTTRKTAYPDASTAIAIAGEMAVSIKSILDALPKIGDKTKKHSISDDIKRISDTARLISLRVVTIVCDRAYELAAQIESGQITCDSSKVDAMIAAMESVHHYIILVGGGKIGPGFSLHGTYIDLMRFLPAQSVALRQEFFLPITPVYGPNSPNYNEGRFIAEVARYNDEFRQAMKRYEMKKDLETINAMRTTLVTMETKNPPSNFRMLLSLSISFMDIAMRNNGKISKENEPLIARLDRELNGVVKGEIDVDEGTISWFMHVIGQTSQFSARIRAFQESYELIRLIEESQNTAVNDQTISQMRSAMENAQRVWEASLVTQGDLGAARSACFALVAVSNIVGDYALKTMAMAMGSLADGIVDKRVAVDSEVAIFGASILVAISERIDRISSDPKGGRSAADHHRDRVRAVLSGKRPSELTKEMSNQGGHVQAILDELNNDVTSAEQIIDQCLRDGAKESKREEVAKLFNVVRSALSFVNFGDAAAYASTVANHVDKVLDGLVNDCQPTENDKRILAESVMMLHRYISIVGADQVQALQSLQRGQALFSISHAAEKLVLEDDSQEGEIDVCNDEDLGPIFFEEAKGVISGLILPGIQSLRVNPDNEPVMLDVRRGFHTLKGSARMVELNNLGLVGQHAEYVLNIFRDNHNIKPTPELFTWLEDAADFFYHAVEMLEKGKPVRVNVTPYEAVYNHFKDTNEFTRVDVKSAIAEKTENILLTEELEESSRTQILNVHIPETGSVILPAPDLLQTTLIDIRDHHEITIDEPLSTQSPVQIEELALDNVEIEMPAQSEMEKIKNALDSQAQIEVVEQPMEALVVESEEPAQAEAEVLAVAPSMPIEGIDQTSEITDTEVMVVADQENVSLPELVNVEEIHPEPVIEVVASQEDGDASLIDQKTVNVLDDVSNKPMAEPFEAAFQDQNEDFLVPLAEEIQAEPVISGSTVVAQTDGQAIEIVAPVFAETEMVSEVKQFIELPNLEDAPEVALEDAVDTLILSDVVAQLMQDDANTQEASNAPALPALPEMAVVVVEAEKTIQDIELPEKADVFNDLSISTPIALPVSDNVVTEQVTGQPVELPVLVDIVDEPVNAQTFALPVLADVVSVNDLAAPVVVPPMLPIPPSLPVFPVEQSLEPGVLDANEQEYQQPEPPILADLLPDLYHADNAAALSLQPHNEIELSLSDEQVASSVSEDAVQAVTDSGAVSESSGEIAVGDVLIPTQMYYAFINESGMFQNHLRQAVLDAIAGKRDQVDFEVMRMAHSLAGGGRATGLRAVTHLAECIESWVLVNQDRPLHITENGKAVLLDAMEVLDAMIDGVENRIEPQFEYSIVERLQAIIELDEHRIAMAEDTRPDVTESVLAQMVADDMSVGDEGVAPTCTVHHSSLTNSLEQESVDSAEKNAEVAKAPAPFCEHLTNNEVAKQFGRCESDEDSVDVICASSKIETTTPAKGHSTEVGSVVQGSDGSDLLADELKNYFVEDHSLPAASDVADPASDAYEAARIGASVSTIPATLNTLSVILSPVYGSTHLPNTRDMMKSGIDWIDVVKTREDDVDQEMFEIFTEEANERFEEIDATLSALHVNVTDKRLGNLLKRAVHTLKGSANTAGCRKLGAIFHCLEDLMDVTNIMTYEVLGVLQSGVDAAFAGLSAMRKGKSLESAIKRVARNAAINSGAQVPEAAEIADSSQVGQLLFGSDVPSDAEEAHDTQSSITISSSVTAISTSSGAVKSPSSDPSSEVEIVSATNSSTVNPKQAAKKVVTKSEEDENNLRVSARLLDKMVKSAGEINIARSRVGMNVDITKMSLTGLALSLERMYGYLRQLEFEAERQMSAGEKSIERDSSFDALQMDRFTKLQELTRRVAEAQNDVMTQQGAAVGAVRDMEDALANQHVLVTELSSDLDHIRQVRVSSVVPALKRVVRAACRDTGKNGEIFFDADVEIDRGILSKVMGPLEHILRNAVAHGIEDSNERLRLGKVATGTIELRAFQDGGEVVIEIHDDGRGMNTKQIYDNAVKKGLIKAGAKLSDAQIRELIFEPGFSTASQVTDISGRGVGLDVVRSGVAAMGGRVIVNSAPGLGSTFVLRVPATLTVIAGAAVSTNGHTYVIPVSFIDRLTRVNNKELEVAYKNKKLLVTDDSGASVEYDFWGMWQIAGSKVWDGTTSSRNSVLLMRNDRVAVHIDDIRPATEFVFRPMGPQVANSSGLIGSTISSDGSASLVVDPARVAKTLRMLAGKNAIASVSLAEQKKTPLVLIVDDSTTVRKVTARLLKKEGFRHAEAENGMKSLEMLQAEKPDVILMDIEMPVMNGYEASQAIRATPETSGIPIIMITSRVGDSHRQRAMEIGVNEYLGKPYNESDLMTLIRKFTQSEKVANG